MKKTIFLTSTLALLLSGTLLAQRGPVARRLLKGAGRPALALVQSRIPYPRPDTVTRTVAAAPDTTNRRAEPVTAPLSVAMPISAANIIKSYFLELPFNKTVTVLFPAPIRSVDLGSRDIIADKAADVENVLKVKASLIGFNETNFSVITADGKFYSFVANYSETPTLLALNLSAPDATGGRSEQPAATGQTSPGPSQSPLIQFAGVRATQSDVVFQCNLVMNKRRTLHHVGAEANKMNVALRGLYVHENVLYAPLTLTNDSNINYDVDFIRFFVVDKQIAKRTTRQETELQPVYVFNEPINTVRGHATVEKVYAFPKFTIPDDKLLLIQIGELNGGRQLSFEVSNGTIMQAKPI